MEEEGLEHHGQEEACGQHIALPVLSPDHVSGVVLRELDQVP